MKHFNKIYMKRTLTFFAWLFILLFLLIYIKADTFYISSGGSSNLTIGSYISSGILSPYSPTAPISSGTSSSGSSGSIVITSPSPISNLSINPGQFNLTMLSNTNLQEIVSVTNVGGNSADISISQTNLTNLVIIGNTTLSLAPSQTQFLDLIFVAPNATGIYTGTINIGNQVIPVSLNVIKQFILFDSNIIVLNKNYIVPQGNPLLTQITIIPMGSNNTRLDVTLDYTIKNTNGTIYTTSSETLLVTSQQVLKRTFQTGNLPIGNYTIDLELIYPYGVAPSSAPFEVVNNVGLTFYYLLLGIVILIIIILIILIIRSLKVKRPKI